MNRRLRAAEASLQQRASLAKRDAAQIAIAVAQQIEEDDRRRDLRGQKLHARGRRVNALLQHLEVEAGAAHQDDLAVEHAALGQLRLQRLDDLGEIPIEWFRVAALDRELVAVAEDQRPEPVPLRLEDPAVALGKLGDPLREHRQHRRWNRKPSGEEPAQRGACPLARVRPSRTRRRAPEGRARSPRRASVSTLAFSARRSLVSQPPQEAARAQALVGPHEPQDQRGHPGVRRGHVEEEIASPGASARRGAGRPPRSASVRPPG